MSNSGHKGLLVNDTTAAHRHTTNEMMLERRGYVNYRVSSGTTGEIQPNVSLVECIFTMLFIKCSTCMVLKLWKSTINIFKQ